jgi:hypothetical protein
MKKLPVRLPLGKFFVGPDFYGCINTGMAPAILKSRLLKSYDRLGLVKGFKFAVGPGLFVEDAIKDMTRGRVKGSTWKRSGRYTVKFFKTSKGAKAYFSRLVEKAVEVNRQEAETHRGLRAAAAAGDVQAAADLIDYS